VQGLGSLRAMSNGVMKFRAGRPENQLGSIPQTVLNRELKLMNQTKADCSQALNARVGTN